MFLSSNALVYTLFKLWVFIKMLWTSVFVKCSINEVHDNALCKVCLYFVHIRTEQQGETNPHYTIIFIPQNIHTDKLYIPEEHITNIILLKHSKNNILLRKKVKRVLTCRDCIGIEMTMTNQTTFWVKITKGYECYYCKNITHIGWHSNKKQEDFKIFGILFFSVDDWLIATFVGYYSNSCNKQNKTIVTTINCTFYSTLSTAWKGLQLLFWFTYSM